MQSDSFFIFSLLLSSVYQISVGAQRGEAYCFPLIEKRWSVAIFDIFHKYVWTWRNCVITRYWTRWPFLGLTQQGSSYVPINPIGIYPGWKNTWEGGVCVSGRERASWQVLPLTPTHLTLLLGTLEALLYWSRRRWPIEVSTVNLDLQQVFRVTLGCCVFTVRRTED